MKNLFSKEEKAAINALINLNIARGNISDERDINEIEYQICMLLGTTKSEQRYTVEEMIRKAIKK